MIDNYRLLQEFEDRYKINQTGEIINIKNNRKIIKYIKKGKYQVVLSKNGKRYYRYLRLSPKKAGH